jgi:hypothetical protein
MGKRKWRPRGGSPLDLPPSPSPIERRIKEHLAALPSALSHPTVPIVLGAVVELVGRDDLLFRSYGLLIVALWLSFDLWIAVLKRGSRWRFVLGTTGTNACLIVVMISMRWGMKDKLQDQREDVFRNLAASVVVPTSNNPYWSSFTVRNNGSTSIGKREIKCSPIIFTHTNGDIALDHGSSEAFPMTYAEMKPGNAETSQCLALIGPSDPQCLDAVLSIDYSLTTQPNTDQRKQWRFYAVQSAGAFQWAEEPVDEPRSYCALYMNKQTQQDYLKRVPGLFKPPS